MIAVIMILLQSSLAAGTNLVGCDPEIRSQWWDRACVEKGLEWIDDVRPGPALDQHRTIEVRYSTMHATGASDQSILLLQRRGRSYRILWTHRFLEIDNNEGIGNSRIRYRWHYDPKRARMIVSGTESRGGSYDLGTGYGKAKSIRRLPTEVYCYSSRVGKFVRR
jgi:hypothetical protein